MLSRFIVQGFKSLLHADVELGAVNIFIGANGSGKSNLLEALGVIGAAAFGSVEPETLRYRGVRPGLPSLYKTSFKDKPFRRLITLEARSENALYRVGLDNPITSPSAKWRISSESLAERIASASFSDGEDAPVLAAPATHHVVTRAPRGCRIYGKQGKAERIEPPADQTVAKLAIARREDATAARALISALEAFAIYAPTTPVLRGISTDEVTREPVGLSGGGLPEAVKDITDRSAGMLGPFDLDDIWQMIEWADDMTAVPVAQAAVSPAVKTTPIVLRFRDRFMRGERNVLSAYDASEGALYVLFLLVLASHERAPRIFAIDNFDHALHPRLAAELTRLVTTQIVADGTRQMLATSHNPLVLDGLDLRDDRIRLFAVDRDRAGVTRVNRVTVSEELLKQSDGLSLSRLWVMGRLGGVPAAL
jgi:energy-coupling factor transporter ATP-binding protein EcfA2